MRGLRSKYARAWRTLLGTVITAFLTSEFPPGTRLIMSLKPFGLAVLLWVGLTPIARGEAVPIDLAGFRAEGGIRVVHSGDRLNVEWPVEGGEVARLAIDLRPGAPLVATMGVGTLDILSGVDLATFVTVGSRVGERDRPPGMSPFNVFFDNPARRPFETFHARLDLKRARVTGRGGRASISVGEVSAGPFTGEFRFNVYAGARLIHVETVVSTKEADRAFFYDTGLVSAAPDWRRLAWTDTEGVVRREAFDIEAADQTHKVRHRAIVAESDAGSVACFPPPHQYSFPRDVTENLGFIWSGRGHRGLADRQGFGIRQWETGGGPYVPWINAPPGTEQHLGVFYLLTRGKAEDALRETLRYTHNDRFPEIPGHKTFTSHWHMAVTVAAMKERAQGVPRSTPDFVKMFRDMGVNIVHLAEFHGDGHPQDPGAVRLAEMEAMFAECRRLSDDSLLFLPGEEANVHLGPREPGKNAGHWLYLFPKPVYWTMKRAKGEPFSEDRPGMGTVYHVGNRDDMARLIDAEHGLAWTAHARIKASTWAPDIYRNEDFYKSNTWLGAAWKAMPADLSRPKMGERTLNLLDDMNNWGGKKQLLGEVDVFKIDHTHELYGAMNINYVQLDRIPRFDEGWGPVLDAIRGGRFFVTTGEVQIRDFRVGGKLSGQTLSVRERPTVRIDLAWTFPLAFAELISGDGERVYRDRIDLSDTPAFGRKSLALSPDLTGRRWVRMEAWDVAGNGAFSQPVWMTEMKE